MPSPGQARGGKQVTPGTGENSTQHTSPPGQSVGTLQGRSNFSQPSA